MRLIVDNKEFFMKNLKVLLSILTTTFILTLTLASCSGGGGGPSGSNSGDSSSDVGTFLNGTWKNDSYNYGYRLDGNNWTFFGNSSEGDLYKGTWKCSVKPAAGISGATLTLTVTQAKQDGSWGSVPSDYNSVKTNTAKLAINGAGTQMTITEPTLETSGIWDALKGTYTKQQ